jgi:hypothetical protein
MHFFPIIGVLALSVLTVVPYSGVQGFDLRSLRGRFVVSRNHYIVVWLSMLTSSRVAAPVLQQLMSATSKVH